MAHIRLVSTKYDGRNTLAAEQARLRAVFLMVIAFALLP